MQQQQAPQQQQQPQQPQHQQQQPAPQQQLGFAAIQQQQLQQPAYEPARPEQLDGAAEQLPGDASATLYVDGMPLDVTKREMAHIFRPFEGFKASPFQTPSRCAQAPNSQRHFLFLTLDLIESWRETALNDQISLCIVLLDVTH